MQGLPIWFAPACFGTPLPLSPEQLGLQVGHLIYLAFMWELGI